MGIIIVRIFMLAAATGGRTGLRPVAGPSRDHLVARRRGLPFRRAGRAPRVAGASHSRGSDLLGHPWAASWDWASGSGSAPPWAPSPPTRVRSGAVSSACSSPTSGAAVALAKRDELEDMSAKLFPKTVGRREAFKILDTSVIIDGRVVDLCEVGFLEGTLVVPAVRPAGAPADRRLARSAQAQPGQARASTCSSASSASPAPRCGSRTRTSRTCARWTGS